MACGPAILRPARILDAVAMSHLSRDFIEAGLGWRYSPARIAELIRDRETMALVACDAQELQGFAVMRFDDESAHLVLLCVGAAHRRQGIGRRLVDWLVQSARVAGIASIGLELRTDNAKAHAFYRALGFTDAAILPGYYQGRQGRVSALRMQRLLHPPFG